MYNRRVTPPRVPDLPRAVTGASALLETLVVVKLDDLRRRYVQILVDLAGEVLVEQRLELAVLLLQLGDLVDGAAAGRDERVVLLQRLLERVPHAEGLVADDARLVRVGVRVTVRVRVRVRVRVKVRVRGRVRVRLMMLTMRSQNSRSSRRVTWLGLGLGLGVRVRVRG